MPGSHIHVEAGREVDIPGSLQPLVRYVAQASSSRIRAGGRASDSVLGEAVRRIGGVSRQAHGSEGFGEVANLPRCGSRMNCCGPCWGFVSLTLCRFRVTASYYTENEFDGFMRVF